MGLNTFHGIYFRPDTEVAESPPSARGARPCRDQTVPGQAEQTARFYEGEPGHGYPRLVAEPQIIRWPLLCLNDPSDDEELRRQRAPPAPGQAHISRAEWCRLSYRREPGRIVWLCRNLC